MAQHNTKQTITRAGIIVLLLFVNAIGSLSLKGQEYDWTPFMDYPPVAYVKQLNQVGEWQVGFSQVMLHVRKSSDVGWVNRPLPDGVYGKAEGSYQVSGTSDGGIILRTLSNDYVEKLMYYSTNLGVSWESKPLPENMSIFGLFSIIPSKDSAVWLVQRNPGEINATIFKSSDNGTTYELILKNTPIYEVTRAVVLNEDCFVVQDNSSSKNRLFVCNKDSVKEILNTPMRYVRSITCYLDKVVIADEGNVFEYDVKLEVWSKIELPKIVENSSNASVFVRSSSDGNVVYVKRYESNHSTVIFKKKSAEKFEEKAIYFQRPLYDAAGNDDAWFIADLAGVWLANEDELTFDSYGIQTRQFYEYCVSPDNSSVVILSEFGDVVYKPKSESAGWTICTPNPLDVLLGMNGKILTMKNGRNVYLINGKVYYNNGALTEWKESEMPEELNPFTSAKMEAFGKYVFLVVDYVVYVSEDFCDTFRRFSSYSENTPSTICVINDSTLAISTQNRLLIISPYDVKTKFFSSNTQSYALHYDDKNGITMVRGYSINGIIVSRESEDGERVDIDTINTGAGASRYTSSVMTQQGVLYLTTLRGMYRLAKDSKKLQLIDSTKRYEAFGALQIVGDRLYRARVPGAIEYISLETSVSEKDIAKSEKLFVYPQPANSSITVEGLLPGTEIRITDINGCEVFTATVNTEMHVINTSTFSSGVYSVTAEKKSQVFVVQK